MFSGDICAVSADRLYRVRIQANVITAIVEHANHARNNETGGILIGYIDETGGAVITEATGKPQGSAFGRFSFIRRTRGLSLLLKKRWLESQHYLGEWHTHPGGEPDPSPVDRQSMRLIALSGNYYCPEPILLILGIRRGQSAISLTVFPHNREDVSLIGEACVG
ncbi:Mov34/MPN/PAD-1 family protein [Brucella pseudogrignonensis]|uniref:Mov34/MPN/PAD-1 family protein n=1 Tax=Brucella pseudogrignonensis TaxID=419475 RepID=UPI0038D0F09A